MNLQLGLKELSLDSRAHTSPFPPTSTNLTHGMTTFNQLGFAHGRIGPQGGTVTISDARSDEGGGSYSPGDFSYVS
jgi:hypothetical protein